MGEQVATQTGQVSMEPMVSRLVYMLCFICLLPVWSHIKLHVLLLQIFRIAAFDSAILAGYSLLDSILQGHSFRYDL